MADTMSMNAPSRSKIWVALVALYAIALCVLACLDRMAIQGAIIVWRHRVDLRQATNAIEVFRRREGRYPSGREANGIRDPFSYRRWLSSYQICVVVRLDLAYCRDGGSGRWSVVPFD